ncbi:Panacea domain-containing protein [Alcaligenes sp. Marseille-Q7550]
MTEVSYPSLFDERRTAQAAAFLLHKAGGRLPVLKLMKLMYLAERESLRIYGEPIAGDRLVSMPHGPVLSRTYDLMNGSEESGPDGWDCWMDDKAAHEIALRDPSRIRTPELDLLELSDGDLEVLESVWGQFGHMGKWELRDYTHSEACPEWEDPRGSSRPIPMGRLFKALGYTDEGIRSAVEHLNERARLSAVMG